MEKKVTFVKDAHLHIRVDSADLERWRKRAKNNAMSLTVFAIKSLNYMEAAHLLFAQPKNGKRKNGKASR